jgi:hypothetical protein
MERLKSPINFLNGNSYVDNNGALVIDGEFVDFAEPVAIAA